MAEDEDFKLIGQNNTDDSLEDVLAEAVSSVSASAPEPGADPGLLPSPLPVPEPAPATLPSPGPAQPSLLAEEPAPLPEAKPFKPAEPPPPPKRPRREKKKRPSGGRPSPLLFILLIAAAGYLIYTYWPLIQAYLPQGESGPAARTTIPLAVTTTTLPGSEEAAAAEEPGTAVTREAPAAELVDPFVLRIKVKGVNEMEERKKAEPKEPVQVFEPELEGIWIDSSMRVAFISGQALIEGGTIMGYRVKQIQKNQVTLTRGNQVKILKLEGRF